MARQRPHGAGTLYKRHGRGVWIARWTDHNGKRREVSCKTTDKATAERLLSKRISDAALRRDGVIDAKMDRVMQERSRPIMEHVADFKADLAARDVTEGHVRTTITHIKHAVSAAAAKTIDDLTPSAAQAILGELRKSDMSVRTCNAHLRSLKSFSRWLLRDGRTQSDALQHLKAGNADADRKYERRALTPEELVALVAAAEHGPPFGCITGPDRAMLYKVASGTGFRRGEIASLTPASFNLGASPTITIRAAYSKRRREDVQPIRGDLAAMLRPWLADKPQGAPVFALPKRTAKMMQADLMAAGIAHIDDAGRVLDFHALRHTFISRIVESGASVKVAQELARHSDPVLTIGRYSHVRISDLSRALDGLPATEGPDRQSNTSRATGTDGAHVDASNPRHIPRHLGRVSLRDAAGRNESDAPGDEQDNRRSPLTAAGVSDSVRDKTTGVEKAAERTRTVDPRISNPRCSPGNPMGTKARYLRRIAEAGLFGFVDEDGLNEESAGAHWG